MKNSILGHMVQKLIIHRVINLAKKNNKNVELFGTEYTKDENDNLYGESKTVKDTKKIKLLNKKLQTYNKKKDNNDKGNN
mgnify:CR=1 FL=1